MRVHVHVLSLVFNGWDNVVNLMAFHFIYLYICNKCFTPVFKLQHPNGCALLEIRLVKSIFHL